MSNLVAVGTGRRPAGQIQLILVPMFSGKSTEDGRGGDHQADGALPLPLLPLDSLHQEGDQLAAPGLGQPCLWSLSSAISSCFSLCT